MEAALTAEDPATVRVGPMVNLGPLVTSLGQDPEPIFHGAGFQLQEFEEPDHRVSFVQASRLLQQCAAATGCDQIGFLLGLKACPSHLGIAGFLVQAAPDAETALNALVANLDLHDECGSARLEQGPEYSTLSYALHESGASAYAQIYDLAAVVMYQIMQVLCGRKWKAHSVTLKRRQPRDKAPYERFFNSLLYFDSTQCALSFENRWLREVPPSSDILLYQHLSREARRLHGPHDFEFKDELPRLFRQALLSGNFSSQQIADQLGIHERTLHRRLKAIDTSFRQELDAARGSVSKELLESTSLPVCDIANALGYSDSSGFIRAFHRWFDSSPSAWRKQRVSATAAGSRSGGMEPGGLHARA
jgi:AraC-like DNA-binding protein